MKRKLAWMGATVSGLYLLTIGVLPDPVILVDEALALVVFLKCTSHLGYDVTRWLTFSRNWGKGKRAPRSRYGRGGVTIDV